MYCKGKGGAVLGAWDRVAVVLGLGGELESDAGWQWPVTEPLWNLLWDV